MKNFDSYKNQTVGVEIEMTGITRYMAAKTVAKHFGAQSVHVGGTYDAYEVKDDEGRVWSIKYDSSIKAQKKIPGGIQSCVSDTYKVEFITPILSYNDIDELQELVRKLRKAGAMVNETCGMHVHVGASKFTAQTVRNLVNIVASKEDILADALKIFDNRRRYCRATNERFLKELNAKKPQDLEELAEIWYNGNAARRRQVHYHDSRYTICNLHALFSKGTIEFRCFNSTLHAGEVRAAIQFCLALTHQALSTTKAVCRKTETDNPRYTFRCFMLRLGLIGDEFKTCRYHFLKNLSGNCAWRNGAAVA